MHEIGFHTNTPVYLWCQHVLMFESQSGFLTSKQQLTINLLAMIFVCLFLSADVSKTMKTLQTAEEDNVLGLKPSDLLLMDVVVILLCPQS